MIGNTLSHYKIISKLGQGGMGEVYLAEDSRLDRKVALKILPQHLSERAELRERFEREAKLLASLNHPNIAVIYGLEEADGVRQSLTPTDCPRPGSNYLHWPSNRGSAKPLPNTFGSLRAAPDHLPYSYHLSLP